MSSKGQGVKEEEKNKTLQGLEPLPHFAQNPKFRKEDLLLSSFPTSTVKENKRSMRTKSL